MDELLYNTGEDVLLDDEAEELENAEEELVDGSESYVDSIFDDDEDGDEDDILDDDDNNGYYDHNGDFVHPDEIEYQIKDEVEQTNDDIAEIRDAMLDDED